VTSSFSVAAKIILLEESPMTTTTTIVSERILYSNIKNIPFDASQLRRNPEIY
jgi:hypothetical protein